MIKRVLFYRNFQSYTGGHQKVADYFDHLESDKDFLPYITFSNNSVWDDTNPWRFKKNLRSVDFVPDKYDYIFLAGLDWAQYLPLSNQRKPIINLIQGVRHADPESNLYQFLTEKAIRICVSSEVENAISSTGRVNGVTCTISNSTDLMWLNCSEFKKLDILILGNKQPSLAHRLRESLEKKNLTIKVVDKLVPRAELIELMKRARLFIGLPYAAEGFYLPALEAMALCDLVVIPDCIGNRSFCINNQTCLMCDYNYDSLMAAALVAIQIVNNTNKVEKFHENTKKMIEMHSVERERKEFLEIMKNVDDIWMKI